MRIFVKHFRSGTLYTCYSLLKFGFCRFQPTEISKGLSLQCNLTFPD